MTMGQAFRDDPAVIAALALAVGSSLVLLGTLLGGLRANLAGVGSVSASVVTGYRLRLLAVFDAARIEVAVAALLGAALLGVSRAVASRLAMNWRRPVLVALGAVGAYVALAAFARTVVLFSLLGRGDGGLFGATVQALGAVPIAGAATAWCGGLLRGDAGYQRPPASPDIDDLEGQPRS